MIPYCFIGFKIYIICLTDKTESSRHRQRICGNKEESET